MTARGVVEKVGNTWTNDGTLPSGGGATITVQEGDADVDTAVTTLDFDASDFNVTSSPAGEANVALNYGTGAGQPAEGNHTHGGGATITVQEGDVDVDTAVTTLDFAAAHFDVTSSPAGEANVSVSTMLALLAALSDPNADRVVFWDDSAGALAWLTVGDGLEIAATTLALALVVKLDTANYNTATKHLDFNGNTAGGTNTTWDLSTATDEVDVALKRGVEHFNVPYGDHTHEAGAAPFSGKRVGWAVKSAGGNNFIVSGMDAATTSATTTANGDSADGTMVSLTTSTTTGNQALMARQGTSTIGARGYWSPQLIVRMKTDPSAVTNLRYWVCLASVNPGSSATPAGHYAGFRYDTAADGTAFWRCVSDNNSGTPEVTTTAVAVAAATAYTFRVDLTASDATFYINGVQVAQHSSKVPTSSTDLGYFQSVTNLGSGAGSARAILAGTVNLLQNL